MLKTVKNKSLLHNSYYVDGNWLTLQSTFNVMNPSTGDTIAQLPKCTELQTNDAIHAADKALSAWKSTTARFRYNILMDWFQLMQDNLDDLAIILTTEQGKPLAEAKGEVNYAAGFLRWFAEEGLRAYGDIIPNHLPDTRLIVQKKPIGVAGIITPWNFPLAMITRKVGAALAVGCTTIIKPSEFTPLSAIALIELAQQANVPNGVVNLVFGDAPAIGTALTQSPDVQKISFTGSTRVGKLLLAQSADTVKKVSLELGGNAPFIVFDDADLDVAVKAFMINKYRNAGQTCVCANRVYIHSKILDKFTTKLTEKVNELQVGDGFEPTTTQGPLINTMAVEKVQAHINDALAKGAKLITGGKKHSKGDLFFEPTILSGVTTDAILNEEETFGPVTGLIPFDSDEEVIRMANDTEYGLSAYVCTTNLTRAWKVSEALEVGIVGVNEGIISTEVAPFGGVKQSGLGREGSKYGLDEYTEIQYILMGI